MGQAQVQHFGQNENLRFETFDKNNYKKWLVLNPCNLFFILKITYIHVLCFKSYSVSVANFAYFMTNMTNKSKTCKYHWI